MKRAKGRKKKGGGKMRLTQKEGRRLERRMRMERRRVKERKRKREEGRKTDER